MAVLVPAKVLDTQSSTPQPREVPLRRYAPVVPGEAFASIRRPPQRAVRKSFTSAESLDLAKMSALVKLMLRVMARQPLPGPSRRQVGDWMGTLTEWMDRAPDKTVVKPAPFNAAEISAAEYVFELILQLRATDDYGAFVIVAHASRVGWREIVANDPLCRGERMAKYIRVGALWRLVLADRARKNLLPTLPTFR